MIEMRMAREREVVAEMLRTEGVSSLDQMGKMFRKKNWEKSDPRSDLKKYPGEANLFVATPPEQHQQHLEKNAEVIFVNFGLLVARTNQPK